MRGRIDRMKGAVTKSGTRRRDVLTGLGAVGFSALGLVAMDRIRDNGFRQVTTSVRPIAMPVDSKGLKIRVPVSPLWTSMFKAFDASPTSIDFAETDSALQTKIVDGQENPLAVISKASGVLS